MTAEHEPPSHANRYAIERLDAADAVSLAAFVAIHEEAAALALGARHQAVAAR